MAVGGFAWFIADSEGLDVEDRSKTVETTVTRRVEHDGARLDLDVTYEWHGRGHNGTPDGLVVVESAGDGGLLPWDDHAASCTRDTDRPWWLEGVGPPQRPLGEVHLVVTTPQGQQRRRLAGSIWRLASWIELPALAAYLAGTPEARSGLADPIRTSALVQRLVADATDRWLFDVLLPDRE
jgi:hypothetical protein